MLPIPVNMMLRNTVRSAHPHASLIIRRGSFGHRSFLELDIVELERMLLPGPIAPVRRGLVQISPSIERDVADMEKMLPSMHRNSVQTGDILMKDPALCDSKIVNKEVS
jgi:hypothetical protein